MSRARLREPSGHRSMALVELIVAIGALAALSVVVMLLFVGAMRWTNRVRDLDMACFESQAVIEQYKHNGARGAWIRPARRAGADQWEIRYDREWRPVEDRQDSGFTLTLTVTRAPDGSEKLRRLTVTVVRYDRTKDGVESQTAFALTGTVWREEAAA